MTGFVRIRNATVAGDDTEVRGCGWSDLQVQFRSGAR
jgi:hypothetical protein